MTRLPLALLLLGAALFAGCEQEKKEIDNVKLAQFYFEQGNDQLAMQMLATELRANANRVDAHRLLGEIFNNAEYFEQAVNHYRQAIELGCDKPCSEGLLDAQIGLGRVAEAESEMRRLQPAADAPRTRYRRAMIELLKTGDRALALERLQAIDLPAARDRVFLLLADLGLHEQLLARYDPAAEYSEDQLLALATAAHALNRYPLAEEMLLKLNLQRKSQLLTRKRIRAVDLLVKVNLAQNNIDEAETIYHSFLKANEGSGFVAVQNAINQLANADFDAALREIGSLAEANPDSLQVAQVLALAQFGKRDFAAVIRTLERFAGGLDPRSRLLLAEAYNNVGRPLDAIELLGDDADNDNAVLILARARLQRGENERAIALIEPLGVAGDNPGFAQKLAQLWFDLGEYRQVIERFGGDPDADARLMYLVANSYLKLGRAGDAREYAGRAAAPRQALEIEAYVAASSGDLETAIRLFERLTQQDPSKKSWLMLATSQFEAGRHAAALQAVQTGFETGGDNRLLLVLANRLLATDAAGETYDWLQAVPGEHRDHDPVQRLLANYEITREQYDEARARLQPLVDAGDSQAMLLMARATQASDPAAALRLLERSLQSRFSIAAASLLHRTYLGRQDRVNLARINDAIEEQAGFGLSSAPLLATGYLALGQYDKADRLADTLERQGYPEQGRQLRADSLARQGKHLEAARLYGQLLKTRTSENLLVKYYSASAAAGIDLKVLLKEAETRLAESPQMHRLRNFIGLRYIDVDNRAAVRHLSKLAEIYPDDIALLNNLAWANLSVDPEAALRLSARAFEGHGDNFDILDTHVRALARNRRFAEAREIVEARLAQHPDDARLQRLLESLN